jgi:type I restriction enzyme, R subunit
MTPEERAWQQIDLRLQRSGWIVQDRSQTNLAAGPGVAIREALLKTGEADYLLFVGGKAIATVEAKPEGYTLTGTIWTFESFIWRIRQSESKPK